MKHVTLFLLVGMIASLDVHAPYYGSSYGSGNNDMIVPAVVGTAVVVGAACYCIQRESNVSKMTRCKQLIDACQDQMNYYLQNITTEQDVIRFVSQPQHIHKEIAYWRNLAGQLKKELSMRYDSWVKPWNWTVAMKKMHADIIALETKLSFLSILSKYRNCVDKCDTESMVKAARIIMNGNSRYPVMDMVAMLQKDIETVRCDALHVSSAFIVIGVLEKVRETLIGSDVYTQEMQAYEKFMQDERKLANQKTSAQAQQVQAVAQIAQAEAMRRQAKAQEKQAEAQEKIAHRL